jgi:oligopeptide transport system substrate-binding protein
VPKDHITLVPNDNYWGTKPKITNLQELIITDETAAFAKYQNGELDIATVPQADVKANKSNPEVVRQPQLTVFWIEFNTVKPPFDNAKVRLAFSKAYDRDKFVSDIVQGGGIPAETFIPKGMNGHDPSLGSYQKFDAAAAKKMLSDAGTTADKLSAMNITFDYRADTPLNKSIAEYLVAQIQQNLGVKLQANPVDSKTLSANLKAGNFSLMAPSGWGADYPDQQDWFDNNLTPPSLTNRGNNFSGYSNPEYDKLIKQADSIQDESQRNKLYAQAHKMLCQDAPMAFLYQRTGISIVKKYVKGMHVTATDDYPFIGDFDTPSIYIAQH